MWRVASNSALDRKVARHMSNSELVNGYKNAARCLSESDDPRGLGKRLHGPSAVLLKIHALGPALN